MKPAAQRLLGILTSFLLFVATLVIYSSLLLPEYQDIQELRGTLKSTKAVFNQEEVAVAGVEGLLERYDSISEIRKTVDLRLPGEENQASAINQIRGAVISSDMLLNSLSVRPLAIEVSESPSPGVVRPIGSMRVLVDITGDYQSLKTFLESIETNVRFMEVHSLRLQEGSTSGPYNYQLEIDTFYQF
ncbi:MAG: hypothetical protein COT89_01430 [Candidatus Colwellbacteria bacterium CG10_big_fil_rev_8_21_14_0_10_42_22]|uniref:Type 4a pilus biogenesis protein PilO n=1 Tax=Candidatus Colwellbacteria bacterium CG10_big_fil_rev_8_21_14_0_10_42_22 TaxID=1974540 RepID=A0A2H0VG76_9BACT|nr:MAG: hypothetical protein COT89_01430 [Candidatus Colwellbacteria bacterium CG10_big_fil_rev_8_21_14_0_10_42_22]